jgi:hypothetical protein|tara:strand:- start:115 stop:306 length:192 start_codon:yes stop_codon:yes gene_type:complete
MSRTLFLLLRQTKRNEEKRREKEKKKQQKFFFQVKKSTKFNERNSVLLKFETLDTQQTTLYYE